MSDDAIATTLSVAQRDRLNAQMEALYGIGEQHDPLADAKDAGMTEVLHRDIAELRSLSYSLLGHYVRLYDGRGRVTACVATKVDKYVNMGYIPADTLEVLE